jgi:hypothetical protein
VHGRRRRVHAACTAFGDLGGTDREQLAWET